MPALARVSELFPAVCVESSETCEKGSGRFASGFLRLPASADLLHRRHGFARFVPVRFPQRLEPFRFERWTESRMRVGFRAPRFGLGTRRSTVQVSQRREQESPMHCCYTVFEEDIPRRVPLQVPEQVQVPEMQAVTPADSQEPSQELS